MRMSFGSMVLVRFASEFFICLFSGKSLYRLEIIVSVGRGVNALSFFGLNVSFCLKRIRLDIFR